MLKKRERWLKKFVGNFDIKSSSGKNIMCPFPVWQNQNLLLLHVGLVKITCLSARFYPLLRWRGSSLYHLHPHAEGGGRSPQLLTTWSWSMSSSPPACLITRCLSLHIHRPTLCSSLRWNKCATTTARVSPPCTPGASMPDTLMQK